jgi:hypothetical protein
MDRGAVAGPCEGGFVPFGEDQGGEAGPAPAAKDDNWKEGKALAEVLFR